MQQLNPSEISDIIKQRISQLDVASQATNEGTIVSVTDGIIRIHGLTEVQYGEMVEFEGNVFGLALNLERDSVGAVVLGDYKQLAEGQTCRCTAIRFGHIAVTRQHILILIARPAGRVLGGQPLVNQTS